MKSALQKTTLLVLLCFNFTASFAQFQWTFTGGSPGIERTAFNASDDVYYYESNEHVIFRTEDGACWDEIPSTIRPIHGSGGVLIGLIENRDAFNNITGKDYYLSYDHGESWTPINSPTVTAYLSPWRYVFASAEALIFVDYPNHLAWVSTDAGITWNELPLPPPSYINARFYHTIFVQGRLYINDSQTPYRLGTDYASWEPYVMPSEDFFSPFYLWFISEDLLFYGGSSGTLWYSFDEGLSWDYHLLGDNSPDVFVRKGDRIYAIENDALLLYSDDFGATWQQVEEDFEGTFNGLEVVGDRLLLSSTDAGLLHYEEATDTFTKVLCGLGMNSGLLGTSASSLWALNKMGLFAYDLQTATWDTTSRAPVDFGYTGFLAVSEGGKICIANAYSTANYYYSEDQGQSWTSIPVPEAYFYAGELKFFGETLFAISDYSSTVENSTFRYENGQWVGVGRFGGPLYNRNGSSVVTLNGDLYARLDDSLYRSDDLGEEWEPLGPLPTYGFLFATDDLLLQSGYGTDVHVSADGVTWHYAGAGLPNSGSPADFVSDFYRTGNTYILAFDSGLYGSTDSCQTWLPLERRPREDLLLIDTTFYQSTERGVFAAPPPSVFGRVFSGKVFWDENNNGTYETTEAPIPGVKVGAENQASYNYYFALTDEEGSYSIGLREGMGDTVTAAVPIDYAYVTVPPYFLADDPTEGDQDFAISFPEEILDMGISGNVFPLPRPGFDCTINLAHRNHGTVAAATTVSLKLDERLTYLSAEPSPSQIIGDSLVWDLGTVPLFAFEQIRVHCNLSAEAELQDTLLNICYTSPSAADFNLANNVQVIPQNIVGSFDPNDKRVVPEDGLSADEIAAGQALAFTVRFQNTGTFYAERVRITDQLDTALNWSTLELLGASHEITSWELKPGGLLEIIFDQIFLQDSTSNEPESHGFVSFSIERNKDYQAWDEITNTAAIYFDFNEPIFTNRVSFTLAEPRDPVGTSSPVLIRDKEQLVVFPNPGNGLFTIMPSSKTNWTAAMLQVYDSQGRLVVTKNVGANLADFKVDLRDYPAGLYFVKLSNQHHYQSGKLIIHK